jgi:hypothetical protein
VLEAAAAGAGPAQHGCSTALTGGGTRHGRRSHDAGGTCRTATRPAADGRQVLPAQHLHRQLSIYTVEDTWDYTCAHQVDFGVDLVTDHGCYGVTWANDIVTYHLTVTRHPLVETNLRAATFQRVEDRPPWTSVVGAPITRAAVHWLDQRIGDQAPVSFPFALRLQMAEQTTVLLVAGCWNGPDQPIFPGGDEIIVLWQPDTFTPLVPDLTDELRG